MSVKSIGKSLLKDLESKHGFNYFNDNHLKKVPHWTHSARSNTCIILYAALNKSKENYLIRNLYFPLFLKILEVYSLLHLQKQQNRKKKKDYYLVSKMTEIDQKA